MQKGKIAQVMDFPASDLDSVGDYGSLPDIQGAEMPPPDEYLSAKQRDGVSLGADIIYTDTMKWLKDRGCSHLVNYRLVESYSEAFARYVQCSDAVSTYGLVGKHPTTGAPISSPFVQMALQYQKQANVLWYEIFDIVKQNSMSAFQGDPQADAMEALLQRKQRNA